MDEAGGGPYPPRRKREKRSEVRARILAVAYGIFAERGYEGASLERVAEAAGFSKGAVYSNFAGKDELFYELIAARVDERTEAIRRSMEEASSARAASSPPPEARAEPQPLRPGSGSPPAGASREIGSAWAARFAGEELRRMGAADPAWQRLFIEFWLRCQRSEELRSKFAERRRAMRAAIARTAREEAGAAGFTLGEGEAMDLATTVLALSNGLGIEGLIDPEAVRPELLGEVLSRIVAPGAVAAAPPAPDGGPPGPRP